MARRAPRESGCRVYVGNLSYETSWQTLKDHFREAGNVVHADVMQEPSGRSKGCGLVTLDTAAAAAHGDLSEPYLSAMLRGDKGHARLEARRLGEPSPERGRLPDPRPYGEKACEIRRPGEALWRLYDTQTAAVADSPGLSMSVLSLMLSSGHRPSGGAAGYEARRPGDEAAAPGAVVRETSEATAESAEEHAELTAREGPIRSRA